MQEMIERLTEQVVRKRLRSYPAVALLGPRQCGKTTLAQSLDALYFDLETEADQIKLDAQWSQIATSERLIILDESQTMPALFPRLRSTIDQDRKRMGRFMLLGSVSPALMREVSESLAGRLALIELTPFLVQELPHHSIDDLWLYGGYPDGGILQADRFLRWQNDYLALLVQRDLPQWGLPAKPMTTQKLLRMTAALHGQSWNASQLGQSLGLNHQTVNSYMDYITGCFLVRLLEPYHANTRKRLVKSPKVFWRDSGVLHAVMQTQTLDELFAQPWVGASWEGFVIEQLINHLKAYDRVFTPYYLRTSDQHEIDLLLDFGSTLWAVEVKLTSSPDSDTARRLHKTADLVNADRRIIVSRTEETVITDAFVSTNLTGVLELLRTF